MTVTIYSDFRTDFAAHPVTGDIALVTNEDSVAQEIRSICLTSTSERWSQKLGGNIRAYLFELPSIITAEGLRNDITMLIQNHCERAQEVFVSVLFMPDNNLYQCTITYACLNSSGRSKLNILLKRIR